MDTRNKITFLTAGVFSVFWIYVLPIMNESNDTERNGFTLQNTEGMILASQLQLYFIFLGIIVLVIQKGNINFLFEYFKKDTQIDGTTVQSLKNCSACSNPLGPNAFVCPKCGEPTQKFSNSFGISFFLKWALAGAFMFVFTYILGRVLL